MSWQSFSTFKKRSDLNSRAWKRVLHTKEILFFDLPYEHIIQIIVQSFLKSVEPISFSRNMIKKNLRKKAKL